jgi:hypothetical protein
MALLHINKAVSHARQVLYHLSHVLSPNKAVSKTEIITRDLECCFGNRLFPASSKWVGSCRGLSTLDFCSPGHTCLLYADISIPDLASFLLGVEGISPNSQGTVWPPWLWKGLRYPGEWLAFSYMFLRSVTSYKEVFQSFKIQLSKRR